MKKASPPTQKDMDQFRLDLDVLMRAFFKCPHSFNYSRVQDAMRMYTDSFIEMAEWEFNRKIVRMPLSKHDKKTGETLQIMSVYYEGFPMSAQEPQKRLRYNCDPLKISDETEDLVDAEEFLKEKKSPTKPRSSWPGAGICGEQYNSFEKKK